MDPNQNETTTKYQPVTVDVPEERIAEFHAFFSRFLAGRARRGRHGRPHSGPHGGSHGRRCAPRREVGENYQATRPPADIAEV